MSPKARRGLLTGLQILVTLAAGVWVFRMIQFRDRVRLPDGRELAVVDARAEGPGRWRVREPQGAERVVEGVLRPGFLGLLARTRRGLFGAMTLLLAVPIVLMALRWGLLLRGHGFGFPFPRVLWTTWAGAFFNHFLPGAVGGDLAKAYLAASGEDRKAAIAGTVILDRVVGLAVMILLGAACLAPYAGRLPDPGLARLVYGMAGALVVGTLVYFSPPFRRLLPRLPFQGVVRELDGVFRAVREKKGLVAAAAGLSAATQVAGILAIYGLARAMDVPGAALWMFFAFEPVIFIVTALPASLGGWGVQEAAYRELFGSLGGVDPSAAVALSVLYKISLILVSLPGAVLFALGAGRKRPG